jgi:hypothetical protein
MAQGLKTSVHDIGCDSHWEEVEPDPLADITYHCLGCHSEFRIEVTDEELVGLTGDWRFSAACLLSL